MVQYVFDTEPLIAFLYNEPGHAVVADLLEAIDEGEDDGLLATVNASELFYLIARIEGDAGVPTADSLRIADRDVRSLTRLGVDLERANWRTAGEIKAHGNVSLADAYGVALAVERNATFVVGGDDDFQDLPVNIQIHRVRNHGV